MARAKEAHGILGELVDGTKGLDFRKLPGNGGLPGDDGPLAEPYLIRSKCLRRAIDRHWIVEQSWCRDADGVVDEPIPIPAQCLCNELGLKVDVGHRGAPDGCRAASRPDRAVALMNGPLTYVRVKL